MKSRLQIGLRRNSPFRAEVPNEETKRTLLKSRKGQSVESVKSLDETFASWKDRSRRL